MAVTESRQRFAAPTNSASPDFEEARLPTVKVGNVIVTALSRPDWSRLIIEKCRAYRGTGKEPLLYTSANGNVLSNYAASPIFRSQLQQFDYVDADGMPLVLASRWFTRTPIPERCATTDFFHDIARAFSREGLSIYVLGGSAEAHARAMAEIRRRYPELKIAGHRDGYFTVEDEAEVVADIVAANPDLVFVGLGVPKEHDFVLRNRERLAGVGGVKTCGGLLDFISGKNARAPQWMQDWSLEWAFRVWQEPSRLFWRYLTTNVHAVWLLVRHTGDVEFKPRG